MAKDKCVLAYSGGMDSTISIIWIQEQYDLDVVTLSVDLGAGPELEGVRERAKQAGAVDSLIWDVRDEFVNDFVFHGLKAGALYEGVYALSTALGRPPGRPPAASPTAGRPSTRRRSPACATTSTSC
jgi:argininosuccinate synthase